MLDQKIYSVDLSYLHLGQGYQILKWMFSNRWCKLFLDVSVWKVDISPSTPSFVLHAEPQSINLRALTSSGSRWYHQFSPCPRSSFWAQLRGARRGRSLLMETSPRLWSQPPPNAKTTPIMSCTTRRPTTRDEYANGKPGRPKTAFSWNALTSF